MAETAINYRSDNRRELVLAAAAKLFVEKGFGGTSMRDIAKATGMLPGSLYYHFPSKDALLIAVFEEGVKRIDQNVNDALATATADPWARLQSACEAHLEMLLGGSDFASVVVQVLPYSAPDATPALIDLRNKYETHFRKLVEALPLSPETDRSVLRLMLIGAMNHVPVWFSEGGATPSDIARQFIQNLCATQSADSQIKYGEDK